LLKAIAAIARAALPADAFDPCARDASSCPKPPPPPVPKVATVAPDAPLATTPPGVCVPASAPLPLLSVHEEPDTKTRLVARLAPGQCGIAQAHLHALPFHGHGTGWEKVTVGGKTGWIRLGVLPSPYARPPAFDDDVPFAFHQPFYRRPYRRYPP